MSSSGWRRAPAGPGTRGKRRLPDADHGRLWQRQVRHCRSRQDRRAPEFAGPFSRRDAVGVADEGLHRAAREHVAEQRAPGRAARLDPTMRRALGVGNFDRARHGAFSGPPPAPRSSLALRTRDGAGAGPRAWGDDRRPCRRLPLGLGCDARRCPSLAHRGSGPGASGGCPRRRTGAGRLPRARPARGGR